MNYIHGDDTEKQDTPEDRLAVTLLMARALGFLLRETEGIVVDAVGDICNLVSDHKFVVHNFQGQILVTSVPYSDEEAPEGKLAWMHKEEPEAEEPSTEEHTPPPYVDNDGQH